MFIFHVYCLNDTIVTLKNAVTMNGKGNYL